MPFNAQMTMSTQKIIKQCPIFLQARGKILGRGRNDTNDARKFRISGQCCAIGATAGP